jgi:hypothetical protein
MGNIFDIKEANQHSSNFHLHIGIFFVLGSSRFFHRRHFVPGLYWKKVSLAFHMFSKSLSSFKILVITPE